MVPLLVSIRLSVDAVVATACRITGHWIRKQVNALRYSSSVAWLLLGLWACGPAAAAELPGRRMDRPFTGAPASPAFGHPELPPFEPPAQSERPDPTPPAAVTPQHGQRLLPGARIREIRLEGNRAVAEADLRPITAPYQGRWVSVLELHELRQKLSLFYLEQGYVNSGALIPDQEISDGVLHIRLVEGTLDAIDIVGNDHLSEAWLRERIALSAGPPLNLYRLGDRLQLLQSHPLIRSLNSELKPGVRPGQATLDVLVREHDPHGLSFDMSNARSPSVGDLTFGAEFSHLSLTGRGDRLAFRMEGGAGLRDFTLSYALPLNANDTTLGLQLARDNNAVVSEPFQDLDIEGRSSSGVLSISHPLIQELDRQVLLSGGLELEQTRTTLGGQPFSFAPWAEDGRAKVALLYFGQDWIRRAPNEVLALRSTFKLGIDAFGATRRDRGPDSRFFSWLGQAQWARRFDGGSQLILRGDLQLSADPLMTMEQYALGGLDSVRGYRTNQLVRDNALFASAEYRHSLDGWLGREGNSDPSGLSLALFADFGHGWNRAGQALDMHSIYSAGLGLVWDPAPLLHAELYWGVALRGVDNLGQSLQDEGIHFRMIWRPQS